MKYKEYWNRFNNSFKKEITPLNDEELLDLIAFEKSGLDYLSQKEGFDLAKFKAQTDLYQLQQCAWARNLNPKLFIG
jgi:hypothetical protein